MIRRFEVHDDMGLLRAFYSRQEAQRFIGDNAMLFLVVLPKPKTKPVIDWACFEPAMF